MARIEWDKTGERLYETGVEHGVLYPIGESGNYPLGVPWNGLTNVTETPSGAEYTGLYADDIKYLNLVSSEEFGATVEAYTYPPEFAECDGSATVEGAPGVRVYQQGRKMFGLSYKTLIGNDVDGNEHGYKLHLIYGAQASPSERAYGTVNDSPEAITFSWELSTTPVSVSGFKPTALITIDSTDYKTTEQQARLAALEDKLYGTQNADPYLPLPAEVFSTLAGTASEEETTPSETTYTYSAVAEPNVEDIGTYYERSGDSEPYTYTLTEDTVINSEKTYYTRSAA